MHIDSGIQCICDFNDTVFSHSIRNQICTGIKQDRTFHLVGPVIIMCQTAQTGFNSTYNDRGLLVCMPDQITVHHGRIIRSLSHYASRGIGIGCTAFFGYRIMIHHRIHISGRNQKAKSWNAKHGNRSIILPVRLRNDSHRIAMCLQQSGNDCMTKRRMIYICVSAHIYKIQLFNPAFLHILF